MLIHARFWLVSENAFPRTWDLGGLWIGSLVKVVRAEGLEPSRPKDNGFSYPLRLSPPPAGVWGLDYPFTLAPRRVRCRPSSLYTFPRLAGAWLGIAI